MPWSTRGFISFSISRYFHVHTTGQINQYHRHSSKIYTLPLKIYYFTIKFQRIFQYASVTFSECHIYIQRTAGLYHASRPVLSIPSSFCLLLQAALYSTYRPSTLKFLPFISRHSARYTTFDACAASPVSIIQISPAASRPATSTPSIPHASSPTKMMPFFALRGDAATPMQPIHMLQKFLLPT